MEPTPLLPGCEWIPFWEGRQEDALGQRQVTGRVGVLAALVLQYVVSQGGHCAGTGYVYSRELISVAASVYRYPSVCAGVYVCVLYVQASLSVHLCFLASLASHVRKLPQQPDSM